MRKFNAHKVLVDQISRNDEARVASYAVRVGDAQSKAADRVVRAEKELRAAKKLLKKQAKSLEKFKKSGNVKHLSCFGV